ncbi:MAG: OmpA family protein [Pseudomonadota bacterium]|nr:OmpA family protein [Pseudomonadota bacterium]
MTPLIISLIAFVSGTAGAQTLKFAGGPENTYWMLSGNVFECRFEQPVPGYGTAVFVQRAGEDVTFTLETRRNLMSRTPARISIAPPPWQPSTRSEPLGLVSMNASSPVLSLDYGRSNQFMHALREGRMPTVSHETYYDSGRFIQVQVSAVEFEKAFQDYLLCAAQLLNVNFEQIERSKVRFKTGGEALSQEDLEVLDRIIYYVKNDPRVTAIYLDGHTDSTGRRYDNRQISKRRAEAVERYLLVNDIPPEIITTRFHGSRYPVADNATAKGRAENRRVTVRLEVDKDMPLPDEMLFKLPEDASVLPGSLAGSGR